MTCKAFLRAQKAGHLEKMVAQARYFTTCLSFIAFHWLLQGHACLEILNVSHAWSGLQKMPLSAKFVFARLTRQFSKGARHFAEHMLTLPESCERGQLLTRLHYTCSRSLIVQSICTTDMHNVCNFCMLWEACVLQTAHQS